MGYQVREVTSYPPLQVPDKWCYQVHPPPVPGMKGYWVPADTRYEGLPGTGMGREYIGTSSVFLHI